MRVVDRRQDQVLQHADIILRHDFRIDRDLLQVLVAVDRDGDHAAAGGGLHGELRHFTLQALLHLLRLLHHVLDAHRLFLSISLRSWSCRPGRSRARPAPWSWPSLPPSILLAMISEKAQGPARPAPAPLAFPHPRPRSTPARDARQLSPRSTAATPSARRTGSWRSSDSAGT